jgi:hypothetical protein
MKIAVLYGGLPRLIKKVMPNHRQYLLGNNDCDTFFYLWNAWGNTQRGACQPIGYVREDQLTDDDMAGIVSAAQPTAYKFYDLRASLDETDLAVRQIEEYNLTSTSPWKGYPRSFVREAYGIYNVFQLFKSHVETTGTHYDIILKLRTDVEFVQTDVYAKFKTLEFHKDNTLHTPKGYQYGHPLTNNQVAYGSFPIMETYCNLYPSITDYPSGHPESLMGLHLEKNNIKSTFDFDTHYNLIRG